MINIPFYLSFVITFTLSVLMMLFVKNKVKSKQWRESKGKYIFSLYTFCFGVLGGTLVFYGLVWAFSLSGATLLFGHGEIFYSAILFNIVLAFLLIGIGRVFIGWKGQF